jgi:hypothetical protein
MPSVRAPLRTLVGRGQGLAQSRALRRSLHVERLVWLLPVLVLFASRRATDSQMQLVVAGVLAFAAFALVLRRPVAAITAMIILLPIQLFLFSGLFAVGVPAGLLRALGSYRDVIVLGVGVAAVRHHRPSGRRLDGLDKLALAYVVVLAVYLLFPGLLTTAGARGGAPSPSFDVRLLAFRLDAGFVLVFVAARHVATTPAQRGRLVVAVVAIGMVVAGSVVFEFLSSATWNDFVVNSLRVPAFEADIFHTPLPNPNDVRQFIVVAGRTLSRPGSTLLDPLGTGSYLLVPFALCVERLTRGRARTLWYLAAACTGAAVILTYVRSAVLGAFVIVLIALGSRTGQPQGQRARLVLIVLMGLLLFVPVAATSGFATRTAEGLGTTGQSSDQTERSNSDHVKGWQRGLTAIAQNPLGAGLGSAPGIGDRFNTARVLTENAYLQVGVEAGVIALAIFVALIGGLLRSLRRAARAPPALAGGCYAAGVALAIGALFLHVWNEFAMSLTFWAIAGVALAPLAAGEAGAKDVGVGVGAGVPAENVSARQSRR